MRLSLDVALPFGACLWFIFLQTMGPRYERFRRSMRVMYAHPLFPFPLRGLVGALPILAVACFALGVGGLGRGAVAQWSFFVAIDLILLAMVLSYRVPPPFLPAFLRDEIARGTVRLQRPESFDWIVLVFIVAGLIFATVVFPLLILGYLGP